MYRDQVIRGICFDKAIWKLGFFVKLFLLITLKVKMFLK